MTNPPPLGVRSMIDDLVPGDMIRFRTHDAPQLARLGMVVGLPRAGHVAVIDQWGQHFYPLLESVRPEVAWRAPVRAVPRPVAWPLGEAGEADH